MDDFKSRRCPNEFLDLDPSGELPYCFKIFERELSWNDANKECKNLNSTLSPMSCVKENEVVQKFLKKHGISANWIGLSISSRSKWNNCIYFFKSLTNRLITIDILNYLKNCELTIFRWDRIVAPS